MRPKNHLIIIMVVFIAWFAFYLIGIPSDYYLEWPISSRINLLFIGVFGIFPFFCFILCSFFSYNYIKTSLWLAFYASVEVFILDFIMVGIIQGKGIGFIYSHWVQSIGYIIPWISIPLTSLAMNRLKESIEK